MRHAGIVIFLLIVLTIYSLVNYYIVRRGWYALEGRRTAQRVFLALMLVLIVSYIVGRLLVNRVDWAAGLFLRVGSIYMALWVHLFLILLLVDLLRLVNSLARVVPADWAGSAAASHLAVFALVFFASAAAVAGGYVNSLHPKVHRLDVRLEAPGAPPRALTIAMASDLHVGVTSPLSRVQRIVDMMMDLRPDLVLLPGDIVDESVSTEEEEEMIGYLRRLSAPLGVFSVIGNHEVYSGLKKNIDALGRAGIRVLQDEAVRVDGAFVLAGRKDPAMMRRGESRTPVRAILEAAGVRRGEPVVLMDHQPVHLAEAEEAGVGLQLSGHTHAGQIIPLNFINRWVWECNWGYLRKGRTQYYVSCGVGTWGPPVRTGSVPEIMRIRLEIGPGGEGAAAPDRPVPDGGKADR